MSTLQVQRPGACCSRKLYLGLSDSLPQVSLASRNAVLLHVILPHSILFDVEFCSILMLLCSMPFFPIQEFRPTPKVEARALSSLALLALYKAVMVLTSFPRFVSARDRRSRKASHASSRLSCCCSQLFP